jgi:uncharacterized OB-fold protein
MRYLERRPDSNRRSSAWEAGFAYFEQYVEAHGDASVPIKAISEMLGHSDITTTLRVYAHVLPTAHEQAANAWDRMLKAERPKERAMPSRPQPRFPEPNTQTYWEDVKAGKLTYQQCADCNEVVFTPRLQCISCGSANLVFKESSGAGEVYTYSVVRQNRNPVFTDLGAYILAWIDLDEGFRMLSNVVGVDDLTTGVHPGQRVQVEFEEQDSGDFPIPVFRPV